jgi:hypothetical protein
MKTVYHSYYFDISKPDEKKAWNELKSKLAMGPHCMEVCGAESFYSRDRDGTVVDLETEHLFENQWNTAPIPAWGDGPGYRVFDWALDVIFNNGVKNTKQARSLSRANQRDARDPAKHGQVWILRQARAVRKRVRVLPTLHRLRISQGV